jgi:undecaprenyl-diphosphatase
VSRWAPPPWVARWMVGATRLGDGWAWIAVLAAGVVPADHAPMRAVTETAAAIAAVNVAQLALKHALRRPRPAVRATRPMNAPDRFSFPSGHTMNAFAVAVLVTVHVPEAGPWAFALAGSVGASRVVLQLHFVSDVVAGALLGSVLAAAVAALRVG